MTNKNIPINIISVVEDNNSFYRSIYGYMLVNNQISTLFKKMEIEPYKKENDSQIIKESGNKYKLITNSNELLFINKIRAILYNKIINFATSTVLRFLLDILEKDEKEYEEYKKQYNVPEWFKEIPKLDNKNIYVLDLIRYIAEIIKNTESEFLYTLEYFMTYDILLDYGYELDDSSIVSENTQIQKYNNKKIYIKQTEKFRRYKFISFDNNHIKIEQKGGKNKKK